MSTQSPMEWFLVVIKLILLVTLMFGIEYLIARINWNKSNKI
ncbi:hypothetical protein [Bacillus sp. NPDC094077]